jgi:prepilin peptidase CpaA
VTFGVLLVGTGAAAGIDIATRRIPNPLSVAVAAGGIVAAAAGVGDVSLGSSLAGFALGLLLMLPAHVLGALGAGDVKLFAAVGAVIGAGRIVPAFLYTGVAGGLLAIGVAASRGRLASTVCRTGRLLAAPDAVKAEIESPHAHNRFPYGPAIAAGSVAATVWGI